MRIVGVDDVGPQLLQKPRQPPRRAEIHFRPWRQRHEIQALGRALAQLPVRVRDQHGAVAERTQAHQGDEDLVLPPSPGARRVDVEGEHLIATDLRARPTSFERI